MNRATAASMVGLFGVLFAAGCNGEEDSAGPLVCSGIAAEAGDNKVLILGNTVALDATASETCKGGSSLYNWTFDAVPAESDVSDLSLTDNNSPSAIQTSFTPDVAGDYVLALTVEDQLFGAESTPDMVVVTVEPGDLPPVADCGGDVVGEVGRIANIDGSGSYDPEARELDYTWSLAGVPGCSALDVGDLYSAGGSTASIVPDCEGYFTVSLVVSDGSQYSGAEYCNVRVGADDTLPVADAGDPGTVPPCDGDLIHLNGYGSYDPEGDPLEYEWSLVFAPKGSATDNTNFNDRTLADPKFQWDVVGTYRFQLQVWDGTQWSAPDIVDRTVTGADNHAPVANAGSDVIIELEADCETASYVWTCDICPSVAVTLDATASFDPDGDDLGFVWSETTGTLPLDSPNSAFTFAHTPEVDAVFDTPIEEDWTVELQAADCADNDSDSISISMTCIGVYSP